jgi:hypothetical protein
VNRFHHAIKSQPKAKRPAIAPTSSIKIPKESFEDDRERQQDRDTYEARFYALNNPPTRAAILAQARASGFVPTLAGKPIEDDLKARPKKRKGGKKKAKSVKASAPSAPNEVSIVETLRVARRAFEASQRQPAMTIDEIREQVRRRCWRGFAAGQ